MDLGSRLDFIPLNGVIWGGQLFTASPPSVISLLFSQRAAAACLSATLNK